jgi:hypothetical protein
VVFSGALSKGFKVQIRDRVENVSCAKTVIDSMFSSYVGGRFGFVEEVFVRVDEAAVGA